MKIPYPRQLLGLAIAILCIGSANAQVITIDLSNLSAVTFTTTGANSAITDGGSYNFDDGIALLSFFTSPVTQDVNIGGTPSSNSFSDSFSASNLFTELDSWDDSDPFSSTDSVGTDITLWNPSPTGNPAMEYNTGTAAFVGQVTFDLSGYANTGFFPANGATGNVVIWNGNGTIGTWQVVNAVPEPSTYAAIFGVIALLGAVAVRRRAKRA